MTRTERADLARLALESAGYRVIEVPPERTVSRRYETSAYLDGRHQLTAFGFDRLEALQRLIGALGVEETWSS